MIRRRAGGVLQRHTLERRLFGWLLALLLVPSLLILGSALIIGSRSMQLVGTLGPWNEVAESGRSLFDAAGPAARNDTTLSRALDAHQRNLSASLTQARRWTFLGQRAQSALPWVIIVCAALLGALSMWVSRRIARELARPIEELVAWTGMLGRGEALPADVPESNELLEVRTLRSALRTAASEIAAGQARALESERVRAWGEMARRVAHEMKNPLTPLRLAVHRLEGMTGDGAREPMEVITQETARLDELARQFAVLGRPLGGPRSEIDMVELVAEILRTDVPADVGTSLAADENLPHLFGHHDAIHRAIRNLVRNAVEAVRTTTARAGLQTGRIDVRVQSVAGGVRIDIEDSGGGIPEDSLSRIFEADYTLKAGGTGLGLAVVKQAVAAHDGTVTARNGSAGAIFEVWMPFHQRT
jgi:nitrogen fixation/metabolism regulation signal transduction histidine kinase